VKLKFKKKTRPNLINRLKKKVRIRKDVHGTTERPRLSVYRSLKHFYVQVIDDIEGKTIAFATSREKSFAGKSGKEAAMAVGAEIAKRAQAKNVVKVVFDRNGYLYHGRVKALAEAAREAGLKF